MLLSSMAKKNSCADIPTELYLKDAVISGEMPYPRRRESVAVLIVFIRAVLLDTDITRLLLGEQR